MRFSNVQKKKYRLMYRVQLFHEPGHLRTNAAMRVTFVVEAIEVLHERS